MRRPLTVGEAFTYLLALAAAVAALSSSFVLVFDGRDWQAVVFALGGGYLVLWAALRLTGPGS